MPIKITRQRGRPSAIENELLRWGFVLAKEIEDSQKTLDFVSSGDSLNEYEVSIKKKNEVEILMSDYLKYSMAGRGRHPGGGMAPISEIVDWIETKGITVPEDFRTIESFAWAIAKKQQAEGNKVHRNQRPGIPIEMFIVESFEMVSNEMAFNIANAAADEMLKNIKSYKK